MQNSNFIKHYAKGYESEEHKYKAREYYDGRWHYYYDRDLLDDGDVMHYPVGKKAKNHANLPEVHTVTGHQNITLVDGFSLVASDLIESGKKFVDKAIAKINETNKNGKTAKR